MTTITIDRATVEQVLEAWDDLPWYQKPTVLYPHMDAFRAALAEPSVEPVKQCMAHGECFGGECIYQRPAEPGQEPEPPPEAQTEAEKVAYCAGWWAALEKARKAGPQEPDSPERRCGGPGCDLKCCQPVQEPASKMTAGRAAYFMARFKREEKMLGPNEQAALDFVISMLEAALAEPDDEPDDEPTYCPTCGEEDGGTTCGMPDCGLRCGAEPVQKPVAWADKISFESAMNIGKGHDVWPKEGDYETRTGRALIGLYTAPLQRPAKPQGCAHCNHPLYAAIAKAEGEKT